MWEVFQERKEKGMRNARSALVERCVGSVLLVACYDDSARSPRMLLLRRRNKVLVCDTHGILIRFVTGAPAEMKVFRGHADVMLESILNAKQKSSRKMHFIFQDCNSIVMVSGVSFNVVVA